MNKQGFSLIETMLGAVAGSLILLGLLFTVNRLIVAEQRLISYTELQYEVDFVMNSLANDMRVADSMYWASPYLSLYMPDTHKEILYSLNERNATRRIMKNSQPLTGDTNLARINITKFSVKKLRNNLIMINLAAESLYYRQKYELETVIEVVNMGR